MAKRPATNSKATDEAQPQHGGVVFPPYKLARVEDLVPYARNARVHSPAQIALIAGSIREFGFTNAILTDGKNGVVAGHGRLFAAQKLGMTEVPTIELAHLNETQKKAYILADNQLALKAGWDEAMLAMELGELHEEGYDLSSLGFDDADLKDVLGDGAGGDGDDEPGSLLARTDITIAEPRHELKAGDHYLLDGKHHLLVASVMKDWPIWKGLLTKGAIFCPYPGVFVPFGKKARENVLILVQPDVYIAGHIVDRMEDCFGSLAVQKVATESGATAEPAESEAETVAEPSDIDGPDRLAQASSPPSIEPEHDAEDEA